MATPTSRCTRYLRAWMLTAFPKSWNRRPNSFSISTVNLHDARFLQEG